MKIYYNNGMFNSQNDVIKRSQCLTEKSKKSVEPIWNGVYDRLIFGSETVDDVISKIFKVVSEHSHSGICLLAHSHGAVVTYDALEKFRKSQSADTLSDREIYVFTFGGATHISAHLGKRVVNFENRCAGEVKYLLPINFQSMTDWISALAHSEIVVGNYVLSGRFSRVENGHPIFRMESGGSGHRADSGYEEAMLKVIEFVISKTEEYRYQRAYNYGRNWWNGSQNKPELVDNAGELFRSAHRMVKLDETRLMSMWGSIKDRLSAHCELVIVHNRKAVYLSKSQPIDHEKVCVAGNFFQVEDSNSTPQKTPAVSRRSTSQGAPRAKAQQNEGCCGCLIA